MTAHTAAGKLQGLSEDSYWYEAAFVVGVTNALNVVADVLSPAGFPTIATLALEVENKTAAVYQEIREFYACEEVPLAFKILARDPVYLKDFWQALRRAFTDNRLSRKTKEALAFAVSMTTRSPFGTSFHLEQMRRFGTSDDGVMEILGVTQMFSSYTKIADMLQLQPDMGDIAPGDPSPPPR